MRALVWHGPNDLRLQERDQPEPDGGESLVRVSAVGICGSDIHGYTGASGRRTPGMVMGHEVAGTIAKATDGSRDNLRVAVNPLVSCGKCAYCDQGLAHLCPDRKTLGVNMGEEGAFAEYIAIPEENLVPLAPEISDEEGAMAEPLAVGLRAVNLSGLTSGESTLVLGAGTIGLCVLLICRHRGLDPVFISDRVPHRLAAAGALGGQPLNADETDAAERVLEATSGLGVGATLDAVGIGPTIRQALQSTRRGGEVILVGLAKPQVELALYELVPQERVIRGSYAYSAEEYREAVGLINERAVDVRPLIERTVSLEDAPQAFEDLASGRDPSVKVMVTP